MFEKQQELEKVLYKYSEVFAGIVDSGKSVEELIMDAYKLNKPVTCFNLGNPEKADYLARDLEDYFFVGTLAHDSNNIEIYVSRFETLITTIMKFNGLSDEIADLSGLFFGKSLNDIVDYCLKENPTLFKK